MRTKVKTNKVTLPIEVDLTPFLVLKGYPCPLCGGKEWVCYGEETVVVELITGAMDEISLLTDRALFPIPAKDLRSRDLVVNPKHNMDDTLFVECWDECQKCGVVFYDSGDLIKEDED